MCERELKRDEEIKREKITNGYATLYAKIEQVKNELAETSEKDVFQIGKLRAELSLLMKQKKTYETNYFNY